MTRSLIIDPSGTVTRRLHRNKIQPSFTPAYSDKVFCLHEVRKPHKRQIENKDVPKHPASFSSHPSSILPHIPASIQKPLQSRRRNHQNPTSRSKESQCSSHQPKPLSNISHESALAVVLKRNQPAPLSPTRNNMCRLQSSSNLRSSKKSKRRDSDKTVSTYPSLGTSSMLDKYAFMSYRFPIHTTMQKLILTKRPNGRDISIETNDGVIIGSIDYSLTKARGNDIRILKDVTGRPCAIIQKKLGESSGRSVFRVFGDKPCAIGQKPTANDKMVNGCYLWAEVRNAGSMGGKFILKRYHSAAPDQHYSAKRFGSIFSKGKSKGFSFLNSDEKECAKMITLKNHRAKGFVVAPGRDLCLMLAFCTVVDEMVQQRLR